MRKEAVLSEATMAELAGAIENEQDFNEVIKLNSLKLLRFKERSCNIVDRKEVYNEHDSYQFNRNSIQ